MRRGVQQAQAGHRGRTTDPLDGIRRVLRAAYRPLVDDGPGPVAAQADRHRPDGEVTLAWTVAQDLIALYRLEDPDQARARAERLITDLCGWPIGELADSDAPCTPGASSSSRTSTTPT